MSFVWLTIIAELEKVEAALKGLENEKRGDVVEGLTDNLSNVLKRDDAISGLAGQLLPQLTQNGLLPEVTDLKQFTGLLNVLNAKGLVGDLSQLLTSLLGGLGDLGGLLPVKRDILSDVSKELGLKRDDPVSSLAGKLLPQLTQQGILPEATSLTQLTSLLNVINAKGLLSTVTSGVLSSLGDLGNLEGLLPIKRDILSDASKELGLKRDDPVSSLAGKLLPQLTQQGILPEATSLTQLTSLLNVINAKGLLSTITSGVLSSLGNLGNLESLVPILKRDDAISGLAGQLLPQLTQNGLLPEVTDLKQFTGLLNVLNAKGLVGDLSQLLTSLLGGLPL